MWQEKVRAARPWSAPPLCSPSVQEQRQRSEEAAGLREAAANDPRSLAAAPRAEYTPPERPYLAAAASRGGPPLAHLAPPRPISADSGRTMYRSSTASGGLVTGPGHRDCCVALKVAATAVSKALLWEARLGAACTWTASCGACNNAAAHRPHITLLLPLFAGIQKPSFLQDILEDAPLDSPGEGWGSTLQ